MNTNLYNHDGTLSTQAQLLLSPKPADMSVGEWRKILKEFRSQLSKEEVRQFAILKKKASNARYYDNNKASEWRKNNSDKIKEYSKKRYWNDRERLLSNSKKWHKENPQKSKINNQRWIKNNPEAAAQAQAKQRIKRKEYNNDYSKNWQKAKRKADPTYRLMASLRARCNQIVKCLSIGKKPASTLEMCGCSFEDLKKHFESLFTEGMTWENYGKWVVDHVRPVCSFSAEEWKQVNHYTNLQPLWSHANTMKSTADKQLSRNKQ